MEPCEPALLLRRYTQSGCQEAFAALVERYVGLVYGAALRRLNGDAAGAEDVVQRVFLDLSSEAHRLRADSQLGGWLYRRAVRVAADAQKADRRRRAREVSAAEWGEVSQPETGGHREILATVEEALARLPRRHREVLELRFLEERPIRAVGEALGLSEDAAQKRVARALEKLRVLLRGPSGASLLGVVGPRPGHLAGAAHGVDVGSAAVLTFSQTLLMIPGRVGRSLLLQTSMNAKPLLAAAAALVLVTSFALPWFRSSTRSGRPLSGLTSLPVLAPSPQPPTAPRRPPPANGPGARSQSGVDASPASAPLPTEGASEPSTRQRVEAVTLQRYEEKMERLKRRLNLTPEQMEVLAAHHLSQREKWIEYLTGAAEHRADPQYYSLEAGYREDVPASLHPLLSADQLSLYQAYDANKRTNHIEAVTSGEINYLAQRLDLDAEGKDALFARLAEINQADLFADLGGVADLDGVARQADQDLARRRVSFAEVLDADQMKIWEGVVSDYRRELLKRFGNHPRTAGQEGPAPEGQKS